MMPTTPPPSALALAEALQKRELRAEDVARTCLDRIAARDPALHAWVHVDPDQVLAQARALDQGPIRGLLHGIPVGVKDIFDTFDMPTAYGSPIYAHHRPGTDAAPVALAREAGALLMGKTVTTEFATFQAGPTRNPHNVDHTPGGSSSGACAAVADGMVALAFGSQTAASIIRPAAFCGVVGYKPSFGSIARAGVKGLSDYLDTIGAVARSVEDVAFFSSVLTGDGALRSLPTAMRPRVGVCKAHWDGLTPAAQQVIDDAAAALSAAGAQVIELPFSDDLHALTQAHIDIMAFEVARTLADERLRHLPLISAPLRAVIDKGLAMPYAHYAAQLQQVARVRAGLPARWSDVDVVLAPSAAGEAPLFEAGTGDPTWCRAWTVLGLPCIHLPFATGPQGLPLGLQVVGPLHGDHMALATAAWIHARLTR